MMAFAGGWSIKNTVKFIIFLCSSGTLLIILYNTRLFYIGLAEGNIWIVVLLCVCCLAAGGIVTFLIGKHIKEHLIQIIGATIGAIVSLVLLSTVGIPEAAKIAITFIAGVAGFLLFKCIQKPVIIGCTSLIGSVLFVHGIS